MAAAEPKKFPVLCSAHSYIPASKYEPEYDSMDLYHSAAGRRLNWFLQGQESYLADYVGGVRRVAGLMRGSGNF